MQPHIASQARFQLNNGLKLNITMNSKYKTYFVKPAEGRVILDPNSLKPIPSTGVEVPANSYWLVLIRDQDVIISEKDIQPAQDSVVSQKANPADVSSEI
jgi:hypothetical protein